LYQEIEALETAVKNAHRSMSDIDGVEFKIIRVELDTLWDGLYAIARRVDANERAQTS
jgi:ribosomal protein S12